MTDIQLKQKIDDFIYENISGDILATPLNTILKDLVDFVNSTTSIQSLTWNPTTGVLGLTSSNDEVDLEAYVLSKIPSPVAQLLNLNEGTGELSINSWGTPINIRDYILSVLPPVSTDGVTITGDGTPGNPLTAATSSAPPAIGLGSRTFHVNFDGTSGSGQVGPLIIPVIPIPADSFIAEIYVDVGDGLVANDETAVITIGIDVDDETSALDDTTGLVTTLNANGVTKILTPSLSKATVNRILVADISGSNIISGSIRVILLTSDAILTSGNNALRKTVSEMQALKASDSFEAGQLYCITDAPQCPLGLNIRAFDPSNLEAAGYGLYQNQIMVDNGDEPITSSIWYRLNTNIIHRVYEPVRNNDVSISIVGDANNSIKKFNFATNHGCTLKNVQLLNVSITCQMNMCQLSELTIDFHGNNSIVMEKVLNSTGDSSNIPPGETAEIQFKGDGGSIYNTKLGIGTYIIMNANCTMVSCVFDPYSFVDTVDKTAVSIVQCNLGYGSGFVFTADSITVNQCTLGKSSQYTTGFDTAICRLGDYKIMEAKSVHTDKTWVDDFSTFDSSMDVTGLTIIDLAGYDGYGIITLFTTNSVESIDSITNGGGTLNRRVKFIAGDNSSTGTTYNLLGAARNVISSSGMLIVGGSIHLVGDSSSTYDTGDFIEFRLINNNIYVETARSQYA